MAAEDERLREALLELDAITRRLRRECPVGPRAGRAQHRPAHRRGGLRAGRRRALRRRREAARRAGRRAVPGLLPRRCCSRSAAAATSPRSRAATREKLVRRHPHIFGERRRAGRAADRRRARRPRCKQNWDAIKRREPAAPRAAAIAENLPALTYARKLRCRRAADRATAERRGRRSARAATRPRARPSGADARGPRLRRAVRARSASCCWRSSSWPPTLRVDPEIALRARTAAGGTMSAIQRACRRAADPRLARQPDGRGRRAARVRRARARGGALRAPRPASSRRSSCATAASAWGGKGVTRRSPTSTARSPSAVTGLDAARPGRRSTAR